MHNRLAVTQRPKFAPSALQEVDLLRFKASFGRLKSNLGAQSNNINTRWILHIYQAFLLMLARPIRIATWYAISAYAGLVHQ
jgi:hypothetical protein